MRCSICPRSFTKVNTFRAKAAPKQRYGTYFEACAHGSPPGRFAYLSRRNAKDACAQRFKIPIATIGATQIDHGAQTGQPPTGILAVATQRATRTGANVCGTRPVIWV